MLSRIEKASKYITYCCFTKIKYTLDLIYLFCIIMHVMCTWAAQKHSWELAFELYFYQCVFLVVAVSWGDDLYLSLQSELILGNQCHHLKQVLQHYWDPLPVSSAWVPVFLIHLPFLYLNMMEASPEDDGRIQSGQIFRLRWSCSTCWAPEATPGSYLAATEKEGSCKSQSVFW